MRNKMTEILNNNRIRQGVCVILGICAALLFTQAVAENRSLAAERKIAKTQEELAGEVFRFHVLAESDSREDQAVKLKVRDEVIGYMESAMPENISVEETKTWAKEQLGEIEKIAEDVLQKEGFDYGAKAQVTACYFPDKTYGDVFFPKGIYDALRIELGEAKGQNWWCVLYPNLCFTDAAYSVVDEEGHQELEKVLTDDEYEMVTATSKFKIKSYFFGNIL